MKIFLDTEFTGLHQNTSLLSIGLVDEDGRTFYAEISDYDFTQMDEWLLNNVMNHMMFDVNHFTANRFKDNKDMTKDMYSSYDVKMRGPLIEVKSKLTQWLKQFDEIEVWSDCLAYDWVLFNNIFGHAFYTPKNVYYIPFDICTLFKAMKIDPDISREKFISDRIDNVDMPEFMKHNSLWDAYVIKECYLKLTEKGEKCSCKN